MLGDEFRRRWERPIAFGVTVLALFGALVMARVVFGAFVERGVVAVDYRMFVEFGHRWAQTGSIYAPYQLAGPFSYDVGAGTTNTAIMPSLYPPIAGPIFWVLTIVPGLLWWAVPLAGLAIAVRGAQPWTWPLLPLAAWIPATPALYTVGGSSMWVVAGLALGARWGWPVAVVVFKPTLAPLALIGLRHRTTWVALGVLAVASLLMVPEWIRYITVLRNLDSPGLTYSLNDLPLVTAALLTAWSARVRRAKSDDASLLDSA